MDKKEKKSIYWDKYYKENKETIFENRKKKKDSLPIEEKELSAKKEKEYLKQYYEDNKEMIASRSKQYYEANKDKINERSRRRRLENKHK